MNWCLNAIILVSLWITASHAFIAFAPADKELIYLYNATVRAGAHLPLSYASQFSIEGKLHVQSNGNTTTFYLTDVSHNIYAGILNHHNEKTVHNLPLPDDTLDLLKPFSVVYGLDGSVIGIFVQPDDRPLSVNMKKALASVFQINAEVAKHSENYAFRSFEQSVLGPLTINYNVLPQSDHVLVQKMPDTNLDGLQPYQYTFTNTNPIPSTYNQFANPLNSFEFQRQYTLAKFDGQHLVRDIEANGGIFYYPHYGRSDAQYIFTNQTFQLISVTSVEKRKPAQTKFYDSLTCNLFGDDFLDVSVIPDNTFGHHVMNDKIVSQVINMIQAFPEYINKDHINTVIPNIKEGHFVNRVHRLLMRLDTAQLEEVFNVVHKSDLACQVFCQLLPLIGTRSSTLFIKQLIKDSHIRTDHMVDMLRAIPRNIKIPTIALVKELEFLLHLPDTYPWEVRKSAIIAFGSIVNKAYMFAINTLKYHPEGRTSLENFMQQTLKEFEPYLTGLVGMVRRTKDYKTRSVYVAAIYNMALPTTSTAFKAEISGAKESSLKDRRAYLWTMFTVAFEDPDVAYDILWPILANRNEHTEMRMIAYYILVRSNPSRSRINNIYWTLMNEPDEELYRLHYTFVQGIVASVDPFWASTREQFKEISNFMQPPIGGVSSYQLSDYKDAQYPFSGSVEMVHLFTNISSSYFNTITSQFNHYTNDEYSLYINVYGLKGNQYDITNIIRQVSAKSKLDNAFYIELVIMKQQKAEQMMYIDSNDLTDLEPLITILKNENMQFEYNRIKINYDYYTKVFMVTDMGLPAEWNYLQPSVEKTNFVLDKEMPTKSLVNYHFNGQHLDWVHYRHGLLFYNPFANVWQGINRYHSYNHIYPLYGDLTINTQQQSVKLSIKKHSDGTNNVAGIRNFVSQMVFVKDDQDKKVLKKSCSSCVEWNLLMPTQQKHHNEYTYAKEDDLNTGLAWHITTFHGDRHYANGSFTHMQYLFQQPWTKSYQSPLSNTLMAYMNWHQYMLQWPQSGNLGLMVRVEPSTLHAATNVDITFRLNRDVNSASKYLMMPQTKLSTRFTYAVKNAETSLNTLDLHGSVDLNDGHTVNTLKAFLTHTMVGQKDYKICIDATRKFSAHLITGHINVATGTEVNGKCAVEETALNVVLSGQRSAEQQYEVSHPYGACRYVVPYGVHYFHTFQCLWESSTARQYTYKIKTHNIPSKLRTMVSRWWDYLKGHFMSYYDSYDEVHAEVSDSGTYLVDVFYPKIGRQVDIKINTHSHAYTLTGLPNSFLKWYGLDVLPDSLVHSRSFALMHMYGNVDQCYIHPSYVKLNYLQGRNYSTPQQWTVFLKDANQKVQVLVKRNIANQWFVKVEEGKHHMEVSPYGDFYKSLVDGAAVSEQLDIKEWIVVQEVQAMEHTPKTLLLVLQHWSIHVLISEDHIITIQPQSKVTWRGECYDQYITSS